MSWPNVYVQSQCWQGIAAIMGHFVDKRPFFVDKGGFFGAFSPVFPDVAGVHADFTGAGRTHSRTMELAARAKYSGPVTPTTQC